MKTKPARNIFTKWKLEPQHMLSLVGGEKREHWNENIWGHFIEFFCPSPRLFPGWGGGGDLLWLVHINETIIWLLYICMHQRNFLTVKFAFCLLCHCVILHLTKNKFPSFSPACFRWKHLNWNRSSGCFLWVCLLAVSFQE